MEREERMRRRQRREEKEEHVVESMHESTKRIEEALSAVTAAQAMTEAPLATNKVL